METTKSDNGQDQNACKRWLQARTVGLPTAWARLMNFNFVRSTKSVVWIPSNFVQDPGNASQRTPEHLAKNPVYPDPVYYLTFLGKYFFRSPQLRTLRIEQFNRYLMLTDADAARSSDLTSENTIDADVGGDPYRVIDPDHRNYDPLLETTAPGTQFASTMFGCPGARRRNDSRLGVSRPPLLEPSGDGREDFYQQRLLLGLAWWSPGSPKKVVVAGKEAVEWTFCWTPPSAEHIGGANLDRETMKVATVPLNFSYEHFCKLLELKFCDPELGCVCACCATSAETSGSCRSCRFAIGWHRCRAVQVRQTDLVWCPGSLHGGRLDIQRVLFNLHRRQLPTDVLVAKADEYVNEQLVTQAEADGMLAVIRSERGTSGIANDAADGDDDAVLVGAPRRLSRHELQALLEKRVGQMKEGGSDDAPTDQYRVYMYIIERMQLGENPIRLMVQASAGTGKSRQRPPISFDESAQLGVRPVNSSSRRCGGRGFLLTTVYLYCILNGKKVRACAPTGIAAANIELEGSAVSASTLHCFFDLDGSYESRLDFSKTTNEKVDAVINLDVLMLDEVS